jgi:hypothetical protein
VKQAQLAEVGAPSWGSSWAKLEAEAGA